MKKKQNCWEFMKCGREPGGVKVKELGVCPAAVEIKLDKINQGTKGGRSCWAISGTMCSGTIEGSFAKKVGNCRYCDFFKKIQEEEGGDWVGTRDILLRLKNEETNDE
jgi:hypothetical protein